MTTVNVKNLIQNAKSIAIVPSKVAGADAFCAGVGLYYMLKEVGKEISFVHKGKIPSRAHGLIDIDRISSDVFQREVIVSVDYSNTPAAQAQYSTRNDMLEIKIGPVPKDFDKKRVKTKMIGHDFDLIFVVGAQDLDDLGGTFKNIKEEFNNAKIVNIDNMGENFEFGDINEVDTKAESLSSLVFKKGSEWELIPGEKAAKALLTGMTYRNGGSPAEALA